MEKSNKQFLAIAGIINILEGALICAYNEVAILGLIVMAIGLYFMSTSNNTLFSICSSVLLLPILIKRTPNAIIIKPTTVT